MITIAYIDFVTSANEVVGRIVITLSVCLSACPSVCFSMRIHKLSVSQTNINQSYLITCGENRENAIDRFEPNYVERLALAKEEYISIYDWSVGL